MRHLCLVCGYPELEHPPRGRDGGGSFEICPSCGYQFGFDDDDRNVAPEIWRAEWVKGGMLWWSRGVSAPKGWDAKAQLAAVLPNSTEAWKRGKR